eukprot:3849023-Alexandrium_andersonii.AAC.1
MLGGAAVAEPSAGARITNIQRHTRSDVALKKPLRNRISESSFQPVPKTVAVPNHRAESSEGPVLLLAAGERWNPILMLRLSHARLRG